MKQIDLTGVVLNPAARTLDFSALAIDPRTVLAVLHEPTNRFIFAAGRTGLGYASISGSVMTLALDTTDLAPGPLTGFRDDGVDIATDTRLEACRALIATGNATLSNLATGLGTPADTAPGTDAAAGSLIAKVTRLLGTQSGIAAVLAAIRDRLPTALVGGRLSVDGSGVTQPVSAAALPLPAGAAADATLTARLGTLGQKSGAGSAPVVIASDQSAVPIQGGNASAVKTDGSGVTQPVSAAALPLPAGAATSAAQATSNTALGTPTDAAYAGAGSPSIIGALKGLYAAMIAATPAGANVIGKVGLDQTTPGTTNGVVVNSSALPTNAAQDGADPASPAVANAGTGIRGWLATIAGLLKLGPAAKAASASMTIATDLSNLEPAGAAVTGAAMPTGGAGLTGWLSAIWAALTSANQRAAWMLDLAVNTVANGSSFGTSRDAGTSPSAYTKYNFYASSTQNSASNGLMIQVSYDNSIWLTVAQFNLTANVPITGSVPMVGRYWRMVFTNGATAGGLNAASAFTAN